MSKLDYKFKEIPFDPSVLDARFPAPTEPDCDEKERKKTERDQYVRSKMREVRKVMDNDLTDRQRDCLTLYYFRGYVQRQVGYLLGIHQTTVSQHIHYGLQKLRRILCL